MSSYDGQITIGTEIDSSGIKSGLSKVSSEISNGAKNLSKNVKNSAKSTSDGIVDEANRASNAMGKIGSALKGSLKNGLIAFGSALTVVSGGMIALAKSGVEYNSRMEQYAAGFETLLGSAEEASDVMAKIKKDAATTPFNVESLVTANRSLVGAGVGADDARKSILALGNAIAATGGGDDELQRMSVNLQQIKNIGAATSMDIRQFAMAGINIYQVLADATGKTTDEVKDMNITYEMLTDALIKAGEQGGIYFDGLNKQAKTFNGQISNLQDNWGQFIGDLTLGLQESLSTVGLPQVNEWIGQLSEAFSSDSFGGLSTTLGTVFAEAIGFIGEQIPTFINIANQLVNGLMSGLTENADKIASGLVNVLSAAFTGLLNFLPQFLNILIIFATSLISSIADQIPILMPQIINTIITLINVIIENLPIIIASLIKITLAIVDALPTIIEALLKAAPSIIVSLVVAIMTMLPLILETGVKLLKELWNGISSFIPWITGLIKETGSNLINGLWEGISGKWDWLKNKVKDLASSLINDVKGVFGVSSPSKVFMQIGKYNAEGLGLGFEKEMSKIKAQINTNVQTLLPQSSSTNYNQNFNFYTNTVTPSELERAVRKSSYVY